VFRAEGKFPAGMASDFWPFQIYSKTHEVSKLIVDGEDWKDIRVKLQHDILSPQTAASYLPALTEVGRQASSAFGGTGDSPFDFTSRVAFDMFTASMLGKSRGMLFPETAMKEDLKFIEDSILCMRTAGDLAFSPFEGVARNFYKTAMYQKFEKATDDVYKRSHELVTETMEDDAKKAASSSSSGSGSGTVSGGSYLSRLMQSGALSKKEAGFEVVGLLLAAVDTTANYMNWMILNLARNPDKQEALARELKEVLKGGDFNKDVQLPYLQAFYRETHRVTPVLSGVYRSLTEDIVLEGFLIPAGTKLTMNTDAIQRDEKVVENPELFLPERWLASAVEARKGTASEVLDHRLLSSPFSFGPRMCLGARLAELEIKVLVARLVQDWEISIPAGAPPIGMKEYLFISPFPEPKFAMKRR
jgi:cytochrome P450